MHSQRQHSVTLTRSVLMRTSKTRSSTCTRCAPRTRRARSLARPSTDTLGRAAALTAPSAPGILKSVLNQTTADRRGGRVGKVIADQSISLDGFSAGPNVGVGNGMGDGGEQLHAWMFSEGDGAAVNAGVREDTPFNLLQRSGAVVVGRRMFDVGLE